MVWKYFLQIAAAVLNMNQNSILHGSLQLQSIFLNSKDDVRLSNFGRAIRLTRGGTNRSRRKKGQAYNTKSEMLSLGYLLYELCTLRSVQEGRMGCQSVGGLGSNVQPIGSSAGQAKVSYSDLTPISHGYSPELETLVRDLLSGDPTQRPSIQELWTSPLVRNKALNSNVQMPKVFFPQLQVLNEMKNKYNSATGDRHWTRVGGQERNSRGMMGRNNFPLADAIKQIKWDNVGGGVGGSNPYDYDFEGAYYGQLQENNKRHLHPINGDINYRGSRGDGSRSYLGNGGHGAQGSGENARGGNGERALHPQDLKTKLESDWIGQRRRQNGHNGYGDGGGEGPGAPGGHQGAGGPATAVMRKGQGHASAMSRAMNNAGDHRGNAYAAVGPGRGMRGGGLRDELDNWVSSKENKGGLGAVRRHQGAGKVRNGLDGNRGGPQLEGSSNNVGNRRLGGDTMDDHVSAYRKKKDAEAHKLDRCLKFLVMGPIGPWSDNDDFMKNEFNDYVARSMLHS